VGGGVQTGSTRHVDHLLAYCTCPGCLWGWRIWWNECQGKPKYSEKTCPATLSTTNPTWPDPGLNPGRRGRKPATNRFSYGAASLPLYSQERVPGTHFIGGWMDPRACLNDMEKWTFFTLPGLKLPPPLIVQPVGSRYIDWAIPALHIVTTVI
jgi:hypothetical protein